MARLERRAKRVKGKRTRLLEVLSDTKRDRKKKLSTAERDKLREQRRANIVKPGEVVTKKRVLPTIEAKKKKTGIQRFAETKFGKVLTSPKTTVTLAATLAGGVGLAARGIAAVGKAVITRTAFRGKASITTQRALVGRPAKSGIDKIFHKVRPVAARFATNKKSMGLTTKLFIGAGLTLGAAALARDIIGTYPFASFIKEESIQTLNIAVFKAMDAGDIEGAELILSQMDEIINTEATKVPYKNVLDNIEEFKRAATLANEEWRRIIEIRRAELETGTEFQQSQEEARQRKLQERERDSEYFALIREGRFEEAEELLQSELKGGSENE